VITAQEYSRRIETLEWRVDHDINEAFARALNAGPGSGRWADLGRVCREIGDLAASLEEAVQ
jgi:hypothetical protein